MAFSQQELEIIRWGAENGKTKSEVTNALAKMRTGVPVEATETTVSPLSRLRETAGDIGQTFTAVGESVFGGMQKASNALTQSIEGKRNPLLAGADIAGNLLGGFTQAAGDVPTGAGKVALSQEQEDAVTNKLTETIKPIMESPEVLALMQKYEGLDENTKQNLRTAGNLSMALVDILTLGGAGRVAGVAKEGVETGIKTGVKVAGEVGETLTDVARQGGRLTAELAGKVTPKPTAIQAVGQVLQGKTEDIEEGVKAFANLNIEGVKASTGLLKKIDDTISTLAKQVDDILAKDTTLTKLKDLVIEGKTAAGKIIKNNPVETGLKHLEELYTKTGDLVSAQNIKDILKKAKTVGLRRLEVNDASRVYGQEFGQKAFSKLGDPLTSVNAQLFENTRKSLKEIARKGLGGSKAEALDKAMSSLYNTRTLIRKNVDAVTKLQQKIQERGLFEKIGHTVSKYGDILTGGSIRGLVGGLLPRGAGYKVMNALDLEAQLAKNLKIIQDAIKSGSDADIVKILKGLKTPK